MQDTVLFNLISGKSNKGVLALSAFLQKKNRAGKLIEHKFIPVTQPRQAARWAQDLSTRGADVYIRTTPLKKPPSQGRGKKTLTLEANCLWADIDQPPDKALKLLNDFPLPPTLIVGSGHGVHAYWKLTQPETDLSSIEDRNRWLAQELGGDNCWDAAHILRVPNTQNFKNRQKPQPVEVLRSSPSLSYSIEEFSALPPSTLHPFPTSLQEEPLPEDFLTLIPAHLKLRITTGEGGKTDSRGHLDRSANDFFIASSLLELNWSPGQILSVFLHPDWAASSKTSQKGPNYAIDTILKANQEQIKLRSQTNQQPSSIEQQVKSIISYQDNDGSLKYRRFPFSADLYRPVIDILQKDNNRFFLDTEAHGQYLVSSQGESVQVSQEPSSAFSAWLTRQTGLTPNSHYHQTIRQGVANIFPEISSQAKVIPWAYFNEENLSFYCTLDRSGKTLLRTNQDEIVQVVNGTDNIVAVTSNVEPLDWQPDVDLKDTFDQFLDIMPRAVATSSTGREIFLAYTLALPFFAGLKRRLGTLPILHLRGPAGEGKTETLRWLVTLVYGTPEELGESSIAATYRIAFKQMFLAFDDYDKMSSEQRQFFLTAATGIKRTIAGIDRESTVERKVHIPMAVTRVSEFEEQALRRRTLQLEISQGLYPKTTFSKGQDHSDKVAKIRSQFWSSLMVWIQPLLPTLLNDLSSITETFSDSITSAPHKALSPSLSIMYILLREFSRTRYIEMDLEETAKDWVQELKLYEEDFREKDPLLQGISMVFELVDTALQSTSPINGVRDPRIVAQIFKQRDIRLNLTKSGTGLYGTSTAWSVELRKASDRTLKYSPQGFTVALKSLLGQFGHTIELNQTVEVACYKFCWRDFSTSRGWTITRVPGKATGQAEM